MALVLVTEKLADRGLELMREAGHDVKVELDLSPDDLIEAVRSANALVIRSATQVTAEVLEAGRDPIHREERPGPQGYAKRHGRILHSAGTPRQIFCVGFAVAHGAASIASRLRTARRRTLDLFQIEFRKRSRRLHKLEVLG